MWLWGSHLPSLNLSFLISKAAGRWKNNIASFAWFLGVNSRLSCYKCKWKVLELASFPWFPLPTLTGRSKQGKESLKGKKGRKRSWHKKLNRYTNWNWMLPFSPLPFTYLSASLMQIGTLGLTFKNILGDTFLVVSFFYAKTWDI